MAHASTPALRVAALRVAVAAAASAVASAQGHVVPGQVLYPRGAQSWSMQRASAAMICNASGRVDPAWGAQWGLLDLDWNGDKGRWSSTSPMTCEEDMVENMAAVKAINPSTITFVYRNGAKALPWHTSVRTLLEQRAQWGLFMPLAGCMPTPGEYVCGPNATQNLYHDYEQTPHGDCGLGVECGEYVFNHLNASLTDFLLGEYFFGTANGAGNPVVDGFYVDDVSGPRAFSAAPGAIARAHSAQRRARNAGLEPLGRERDGPRQCAEDGPLAGAGHGDDRRLARQSAGVARQARCERQI